MAHTYIIKTLIVTPNPSDLAVLEIVSENSRSFDMGDFLYVMLLIALFLIILYSMGEGNDDTSN